MAIIKEVELDNGITVSYHRIVALTAIVNSTIRIELASYINKSKREQEKEAIEERRPVKVFINTQFWHIDYDADFSVTDAYNYIKNLDQFKGGEDDPSE
jgi:hypothetical protein